MDLGLKGKTIMVAAGSRGLGLGIARQVAKEGARVSIATCRAMPNPSPRLPAATIMVLPFNPRSKVIS